MECSILLGNAIVDKKVKLAKKGKVQEKSTKKGRERTYTKRPVQRKPIEEPKKDTPFKVELKHHEFEKPPQTEEVNIEEIMKISIHFSI